MKKKYLVRYDFPKMCVTFNPNTKYEFKNSIIDFYGDTLEEVSSVDVSKCEFIDLSNIKKYTKHIWKKSDSTDNYLFVSKETIYI